MTNILIGNILGFLASFLMVYTGFINNRKKIIFIQTIQIGIYTASNLVLGGITGAIMNVLSIVRNILSYNNKLNTIAKVIITIIAVTLSLSFNNLGLLGLLPLIGTIAFIWLMNTKDIVKFKLLIIFTMVLWLIYDILILSYVSAFFDLSNVISNTISIFMIKNNNKAKRTIK